MDREQLMKLHARLLTLEFNQDRLVEQLEAMTAKVQKLELAYYQAFPDRVDSDLHFDHQLQRLVLLSKNEAKKGSRDS